MPAPDVPPWCLWRSGRSAVLVVAPHGGRREPQPPSALATPRGGGGRKVNDLYTAEVAIELGEALDASLLVNTGCDRNLLDLNRISQVTARAPWFVALLEQLLEDILRRHERAEVLFVHGWNVVQARCDVGIGHALKAPEDAAGAVDLLTVCAAYATERLAALHTAASARSIDLSFGERYPGRHPNNLLQLFRRSVARTTHPQLAACVAAGRVEAVQLELGVALRWPGAPRRNFVTALREAFAGAGSTAESPRCPAAATPPSAPASLQAYDPAVGIGLSVRIDPAGPSGPTGRVLVFTGSRRAALFIGEPAGGAAPPEGPRFTPRSDGFDVHFDGFALATDDGWRYVDLEDAFAASQLSALRLALRFRCGVSAEYGVVEGCVEVDGRSSPIAAAAFSRHGILQRSGTAWTSQLTLLAALSPARAMRVRHEFPGRSLLHELTDTGETTRPAPPHTVHFGEDRYAPRRVVVGRELVCRPLTRMSIRRPLTAHRQALITFGAAAFDSGGDRGFGFYEYGTLLV